MNKIPQVQRREIETLTITENGSSLVRLPRVHDLMTLQIELDAVITITGAATSVKAHAPANLIDRIDVIANGKDVLYSAPFRQTVFSNYQRSFYTEVTAPGVGIAAHTVRAVGMIDFQAYDGPRYKDLAFQSYLTNLLQARVNFNAASDLFTGGTLSLTSGSVKFIVDELKERDDQQNEPKLIKKVTSQRETWTASNTNLRVPLPVGNALRLCNILATDDDAPSNSVVNNVQIAVRKTDIRYSTTWGQLQSFNGHDKRVAAPVGVAVIDGLNHGSMKTLIDLRNATQAELVFDVATPSGTTGAVDVLVEEIIGL